MGKKRSKDMVGFVGMGVTMGVGAHVVGQADVASKVPGASQALGSLASTMPMVGTLKGAGWVMDELGEFGKTIKKKR